MKLARKNYPGKIIEHILPVLVWLAALAVIVVIIRTRSERFESVGIVQGLERQINAPCSGRIKTVTINLFDKVKQGESIVIIDTCLDPAQLKQEIEAKSNIILAKIQQLKAQLIAAGDKLTADAANREYDWITNSRNYSVDVEKTRLETMQLKARIAPAQIRLKELELNIKIANNKTTQTTGQSQIQLHYEIEKMNTETEALKKEIEEQQTLLKQAEDNLNLAMQREQEFAKKQLVHPSVKLALQPIEEEIKVQEQTLAQLMITNPVVTIESPLNGVIRNINIRPGEIVSERTPILTIVEGEPRIIVAYITDTQTNEVKENMKVQLAKTTYPQKIATSYVAYLGPSMELVPNRLWPNNATPQWGRPVIIPIPDDLELIPGEIVGIQGI
jgi:multidrug resistance efflux pump